MNRKATSVDAVFVLLAAGTALVAAGPADAPKPRLFRAGPLIDGRDQSWPGAAIAKTTDAARAVVDSIVDRGVDFVKLYNGLAPDVFAAAADQARRRGARITADLFGSEVDALEALEHGVEGFEHAGGFMPAYRQLGGDTEAESIDPVPDSRPSKQFAPRRAALPISWAATTSA